MAAARATSTKRRASRSGNATEAARAGDAMRNRAEERIRQRNGAVARPAQLNTKRLLHEVEVHRVELELQNEELRSARLELEAGLVRYTTLFELAPVGIAVLSVDGTILKLNVAGARLLGMPLADLIGRRLGIFIPIEQRLAFADFLMGASIENANGAKTCELRLECEGAVREVCLMAVPMDDGSPAILAALEDVTARKAAEASERIRAELHARDELRRRLALAQEDERRRVARDLHDSIGQLLAPLSLQVKALARDGALSLPMRHQLDELEHLIESVGREVHELAVRLRPTALDDLGLRVALEQLVGEWSARARATTDLQVCCERLPDEIETIVYRVVQEALTNVERHAHAKNVSIVVTRYGRAVTAVVEDDGVGFDVKSAAGSGRLGLVGMRERVTLARGELVIEPRPGGGTTIIARIPLGDSGS